MINTIILSRSIHHDFEGQSSTKTLFFFIWSKNDLNFPPFLLNPKMTFFWFCLPFLLSKYSQNHIKCSRPLCSLPGLQGHRTTSHYYFYSTKLSLLLCNGGQKRAFFSFFFLLENWLKYFFFSCPPEKFYDIWAQLTKISSKSEKLLLNKILWCFRQIGKWKFSQLH